MTGKARKVVTESEITGMKYFGRAKRGRSSIRVD